MHTKAFDYLAERVYFVGVDVANVLGNGGLGEKFTTYVEIVEPEFIPETKYEITEPKFKDKGGEKEDDRVIE